MNRIKRYTHMTRIFSQKVRFVLSTEIHDDLDKLISQVYARKKRKVESVSGEHIRETVVDGEHSSNYTKNSQNELERDFKHQEIIPTINQIAEVDSLSSEHDDIDLEHGKETIHEETNNKSSDCEEKSNTKNETVYQANQVHQDNIRFKHSYNLNDREIHKINESEHEDCLGNEENIEKMTSAIIQPFLYQKESKIQDMLASCWLWDFAGQKEFYATHQVFLSSVAVFILVTDSLECIAGEIIWKDFKDSACKF